MQEAAFHALCRGVAKQLLVGQLGGPGVDCSSTLQWVDGEWNSGCCMPPICSFHVLVMKLAWHVPLSWYQKPPRISVSMDRCHDSSEGPLQLARKIPANIPSGPHAVSLLRPSPARATSSTVAFVTVTVSVSVSVSVSARKPQCQHCKKPNAGVSRQPFSVCVTLLFQCTSALVYS